ncbi:MAG: M15 family metallopeptidase [Candidatus Pacebacteria bacterium]|nr:M15 family metallopeptidase [Candidatus Paceibacterota bacterium]
MLWMALLAKWAPALLVLFILAALGTAYGGYQFYRASRDLTLAKSDLASTTSSLTADIKQRDDALSAEEAKSSQLQAQLDTYGSQVGQLSKTVGSLSKLAATDPQLLAKYSKIYFLNENYVPAKLTDIGPQYMYASSTLQFESDALPFLTAMLDGAKADGLSLLVISAYRSFGTQALLKSSYKVTYGSGSANSFSADQGYSEHQLGTAVDLTTPTVKDSFSGFQKTPEYTWLVANAYRYGFILSYPQGNSYYVYEPWHWRFVGVKLATMLHAENENFYDVDQRTINLYLIALFDPIQATSTNQ